MAFLAETQNIRLERSRPRLRLSFACAKIIVEARHFSVPPCLRGGLSVKITAAQKKPAGRAFQLAA
jgi:hypothetical protein